MPISLKNVQNAIERVIPVVDQHARCSVRTEQQRQSLYWKGVAVLTTRYGLQSDLEMLELKP